MENPAKAGSPTLSFCWHGSRSRDRDAALRLAPNDHAKTLRALASHTSPHIHFCTLFEPSILPLNESTNLTPKAVAMVCCQLFSTKAHYNQERRVFFSNNLSPCSRTERTRAQTPCASCASRSSCSTSVSASLVTDLPVLLRCSSS